MVFLHLYFLTVSAAAVFTVSTAMNAGQPGRPGSQGRPGPSGGSDEGNNRPTEAPVETTTEDTSGRLLSLPVPKKCAESKPKTEKVLFAVLLLEEIVLFCVSKAIFFSNCQSKCASK